ncbi:hypothetical protein VP01_3013g5 [Puccinia sorghi]|uniref:Uncharacterized protein n=1 Tax=Puccinia sorghi TaxID=27349 RepID=A0A0L6V073_9BASI|nr:hypothetical protein VP01_3013g5 [Puccinia sorghi]
MALQLELQEQGIHINFIEPKPKYHCPKLHSGTPKRPPTSLSFLSFHISRKLEVMKLSFAEKKALPIGTNLLDMIHNFDSIISSCEVKFHQYPPEAHIN